MKAFTIGAVVAAAAVAVFAANESKTIGGAAQEPRERPGENAGAGGCGSLPSADDLRRLLKQAPGAGEVGGLFGGSMEWAAVVDRKGTVCAVAVGPDNATGPWQGSRAIAMAKAYTANGFSTDEKPMSTARLYTLSQPGESLWGAGAANPFDPDCLRHPNDTTGKVCGGTIVFGGGVPLYKGQTRVGGLGASGDTACADHEIAKRIRHMAALDPPKGQTVDDIVYASVDGPSPFAHPLCPNTWRNGKKVGDAPPSSGYGKK
jgi:uncharacterized protein GlcG (DUF336 family)